MHHHKFRTVVAHYDVATNKPIKESAICCCCEDDAGKRLGSWSRAIVPPERHMVEKLFPDEPSRWPPNREVTERRSFVPFNARCVFCWRKGQRKR